MSTHLRQQKADLLHSFSARSAAADRVLEKHAAAPEVLSRGHQSKRLSHVCPAPSPGKALVPAPRSSPNPGLNHGLRLARNLQPLLTMALAPGPARTAASAPARGTRLQRPRPASSANRRLGTVPSLSSGGVASGGTARRRGQGRERRQVGLFPVSAAAWLFGTRRPERTLQAAERFARRAFLVHSLLFSSCKLAAAELGGIR